MDGRRIDHIDGLFDPTEYLKWLQRGYLCSLGSAAHRRLADAILGESPEPSQPEMADSLPAWDELEPLFLQAMERRMAGDLAQQVPSVTPAEAASPGVKPGGGQADRQCSRASLFVVVEKILGPEEPLPKDWPVAGTTGYDFLNLVGGLFVDRTGLEELVKIYSRFIDERLDFREVAYQPSS